MYVVSSVNVCRGYEIHSHNNKIHNNIAQIPETKRNATLISRVLNSPQQKIPTRELYEIRSKVKGKGCQFV